MFEVIELGGMKTVSSKAATNHVYLVDVSGSMYGSLPKMRQHLKNIVSMVANEDDTFTVIYFSGRGQCGVVCEGVPVKDIASVTSVQQAIDRWLRPIGLTGFAEPIELAIDVAQRLDNGKYNNFVMLTDGYDNQSNRTQVVEDARNLPSVFQSSSFIEYGWYCDRDILARMAEASGGVHVFAEGFEDYELTFDDAIAGAVRENLVEVNVNKRAKHAVYIHNSNIKIVEVVDGKVAVPETVDRVHSIVPGDVLQKQLSEDHLYLIMFYAAKTDQSKLVWRCLEALGDIEMIDLYTNAFTRQELTQFTENVQHRVMNKELRFLEGKDLNYLPPENAPTVLDVLREIDKQEVVKIVVDSPDFDYVRTTRGSTTEEKLPRFISTPGQYATVTGLTYNSSRPNVSLQTLLTGTVEVPENEFDLKRVPSMQWRNYTVIRDGILNIKALPLLVSNDLITILDQMHPELVDIVGDYDIGCYVVLHLDVLPVINRKMSESPDFEEFTFVMTRLLDQQGYVKGLKACLSEKDSKSEGLADKYGEDAAKWLSSIGVRDYGFSPVGTKSVEASDFYYATELEVKVKGLNSLPSANAALKKVKANKKMTVGEHLVYQGIQAGENLSNEELKAAIKAINQSIKIEQATLSQIVYSMIIGKSWFDGVEEEVATADLEFGDYTAPLTATITRKEIKL